jgi:Flp pilus assembly pilin Flp
MEPAELKGSNVEMATLFNFTKRFWSDTQGQDMIEYSLMAGLVCVGAVAVVPHLSTTVSTVFSKIGSMMATAVP